MKKSAMVKDTMSEFKQKSKRTSLLMVQVNQIIMEWKGNDREKNKEMSY